MKITLDVDGKTDSDKLHYMLEKEIEKQDIKKTPITKRHWTNYRDFCNTFFKKNPDGSLIPPMELEYTIKRNGKYKAFEYELKQESKWCKTPKQSEKQIKWFS